MTTDSASYTLVPIGNGLGRVRVALRYENRSSSEADLDRCTPTSRSPIYAVNLIAPRDSEGSAYNPAWACVGDVSPIVVPPGASRVDTLSLTGPSAYDAAQQRYLGALTGTFQISYADATSNSFNISLPTGGLVPYVARDLSAAIQTDSLLVHLRAGPTAYAATAPIRVTMYNPLADTLFLQHCQSETAPTLEKRIGAAWVPVWQAIFPTCSMPPIAIAPGDHYALSITFVAGRKGSSIWPQFQTDDVPGVYRLAWNDVALSGAAPSASIDYHVSNAFAMVVDQ